MTTDFVRDKNPTAIYKVALDAGDDLPSYLSDMVMPAPEELESLADNAFADPENRLHPIHTKAASVLSGVYLAGNGKQNTQAFNKARQAAEFFDAGDDFESLTSSLQGGSTKEASFTKEAEYALSFEIEEGEMWHAYPINNDVQVVKAATTSVEDWNRGKLPIEWFVGTSKRIVKKANELNLHRDSIPAKVWNLGEERLPNLENAKSAVVSRKLAGVPESGLRLYEDVIKCASDGDDTVSHCVDLWLDLDVSHGVDHRRVTNPFEAFYSGPRLEDIEKQASEVVFIEEVPVPASEVAGLLMNDALPINRSFNKTAAVEVKAALSPFNEGTLKGFDASKANARVTAKIASLGGATRKELLRVILRRSPGRA